MSIQEIYAKNEKNYQVTATAHGFDYTMDHVSRNPHQKSTGTSPTGLLLNALAGCQLMTARSFFDRRKIKASVLEMKISGDFKYNGEAWIMEAKAILRTDADLDTQQKDQLLQFIERFCTVSGVLSAGGNTIHLTVENV